MSCECKVTLNMNAILLSEARSTQEYAEILEWWNKTKNGHLDLSIIDDELRTNFINAREKHKNDILERMNKMKTTIDTLKQRKQEALNSLPVRLSFAARVQESPKWKNELHKDINRSFERVCFHSVFFVSRNRVI